MHPILFTALIIVACAVKVHCDGDGIENPFYDANTEHNRPTSDFYNNAKTLHDIEHGIHANPGDIVIDNVLIEIVQHLGVEKGTLFVTVLSLGLLSIMVGIIQSVMCCCVYCCGYEAMFHWWTPCISCTVKACCWPVYCCFGCSRIAKRQYHRVMAQMYPKKKPKNKRT